MKKIFSIFALVLLTNFAFSETVKLKITYKGKGISGHTVTVLIGGNSLGSGVSNSSGDVTIKVSSLPTKYIDLKGVKTCNGGKKSWDIKGMVSLNSSNFAAIKMDDIISEFVSASGGFLSENTLAATYGLVCGGSESSSNSSSSNNSNNTSISESVETIKSVASLFSTSDEDLKSKQELATHNIEKINAKIKNKQDKINSKEYRGNKKNEALYDIKELKVEKKLEQNALNKVNLRIKKGKLNRSDRKLFKSKRKELEKQLESIKKDRKNGVLLVSENELNSEYEFTKKELEDMSKLDIQTKKTKMGFSLNKSKLRLKLKKKFMSTTKKEALENKITSLENGIKLLKEELSSRKDSEE